MKVIVLASAENDLDDGWHFYEDQEAGVGDYFFQFVLSSIRSLKSDYGIYPINAGFHRMLVRKFHCGIYYTVESGSIIIHRVMDQRRDPKWIRHQLKRSL
ncbi:hypothetical protein WJU23_10640 [Prosthecobacter sp. SYSU 5D2]|uniref:type II toxin-antitoxin system RelE/ParE family toxin n=1 Tax=Prosthecobacter sp. SYSU 5D2 TaxID=3134134 RepID=UPI0031FF29BE